MDSKLILSELEACWVVSKAKVGREMVVRKRWVRANGRWGLGIWRGFDGGIVGFGIGVLLMGGKWVELKTLRGFELKGMGDGD